MSQVEVAVALPKHRNAIANMMQLYIHDFSEQWGGTPRGELGDDGRFEDYPLEPYWLESGHVPLLLRCDTRLAGFALLNQSAHSHLPVDRNMAEFFVARKHRRSGVGTLAAHAIFARYPGRWEAAVARRNIGARAFWRSAVAACALAKDLEELDVATNEWNGPIIRFRVSAPLPQPPEMHSIT